MIHRNTLTKGVNPMALDKRACMNTLAGTYKSGGKVLLKNLRLPEFHKSLNIENQRALVFETNCWYDIILGNYFINRVGIGIKGSNGMVEWLGNVIPMHAAPTPKTEEDFNAFTDYYLVELENEFLGFKSFDNYASKILDAKYEKVYVEDVAEMQTHVTHE